MAEPKVDVLVIGGGMICEDAVLPTIFQEKRHGNVEKVTVVSLNAGIIQRLGFGWASVHARHPRLTMISMPAWGVAGPYASYVALGSGVEATTGHLRARGLPGGAVEPRSVPTVTLTPARIALRT